MQGPQDAGLTAPRTAHMQLKTYSAPTMAQALAEVKKDLGKDAVILHTRIHRVGAVMGIGGRQVVEHRLGEQH